MEITLSGRHQTTVIVDTYSVASLAPTLRYIKDKNADATVRMTSLIDIHSTSIEEFVLKFKEMNVSVVMSHGKSEFKTLAPQPYEVINVKTNELLGMADIRQDGVYDIVLSPSTNLTMFAVTAPSEVHVLWCIPQYLVMTVGEVLFSVSGMDFAYTEAPSAMKSVMSAANLLTITVGLWVYAILTAITTSTGMFEYTPSRESFTYSALMLINTMMFFILVKRYNRLKEEVAAENALPPPMEEKPRAMEGGTDNPAYEDDRV